MSNFYDQNGESWKHPETHFSNYLIIGTGKAWAWHKRLNAEPTSLSKMLPFESELKTGPLRPTGSRRKWDQLVLTSIRIMTERKKEDWKRNYSQPRCTCCKKKRFHLPESRGGIALCWAQNRHRCTIVNIHGPSVDWRQLWSGRWDWLWIWNIYFTRFCGKFQVEGNKRERRFEIFEMILSKPKNWHWVSLSSAQ